MQSQPLWLQITTTVIAALAFGLGLWNAWRAYRSAQVRLLVRAVYGVQPQGFPDLLKVSVVNLSEFPVTIKDAGFTLKDECKTRVVADFFPGLRELPVRLESRAEVVLALGAIHSENVQRAERLFVQTACGSKVFSSRKSAAAAIGGSIVGAS